MNNTDIWKRPWHLEKFDDIYNRDERFFAIVLKGLISWLNRNIVMYNNPINHFIFNTGSTYMYVESNGYEYSWCETTGEDQMYMHLPRCLMTIGAVNVEMEELTQPYSRGLYERKSSDNKIKGYNAEIRRLPVSIDITLKYVLSNFNESIILIQELIDSIFFQRYYKVSYLGQQVECSIEFSQELQIAIDEIDMSATDMRNRSIELTLKINTNYPIIDIKTEVPSDQFIDGFRSDPWLPKQPDPTPEESEYVIKAPAGMGKLINELNVENKI